MFAVEMLPAGHGDALIVEYGTSAAPTRVLIDAGPYHSWDAVRSRLLSRRSDRYEAFVITHVDEDHIGGSIALLDDPDLKQRVSAVWFNGFVHCEAGGNVLGPVNGEQLTERIVNGAFDWNRPFPWPRSVPAHQRQGVGGPAVVPSQGSLPAFDLPGGARVVLLAPSGPKLKRMAKVWKEEVVGAGLVPGAGDAAHTTAPRPHQKTVDELPDVVDRADLQRVAAKSKSDGSVANGTSIAFVLEYRNKRLLLTGDAHADVVTKNLARYGAMVGEPRPRIDLVKLAHHGSGANLSAKLLEAMQAHRFLVSSNGDNFGHPDDSAIARVVLSQPDEVTFYCNYRSTRTEPWRSRGVGVGAKFELPAVGKAGMRVTV